MKPLRQNNIPAPTSDPAPPVCDRDRVQWETRDKCSERWRSLMIAAQAGDSRAYEQLVRELDHGLKNWPPWSPEPRRDDQPKTVSSTADGMLVPAALVCVQYSEIRQGWLHRER